MAINQLPKEDRAAAAAAVAEDTDGESFGAKTPSKAKTPKGSAAPSVTEDDPEASNLSAPAGSDAVTSAGDGPNYAFVDPTAEDSMIVQLILRSRMGTRELESDEEDEDYFVMPREVINKYGRGALPPRAQIEADKVKWEEEVKKAAEKAKEEGEKKPEDSESKDKPEVKPSDEKMEVDQPSEDKKESSEKPSDDKSSETKPSEDEKESDTKKPDEGSKTEDKPSEKSDEVKAKDEAKTESEEKKEDDSKDKAEVKDEAKPEAEQPKPDVKPVEDTTPKKPLKPAKLLEVEEFQVKFKNFSYLHCQWLTEEELTRGDKRAGQKIKRWQQKRMKSGNALDFCEDEAFNPDYVEVDRVLDYSEHTDPQVWPLTQFFSVSFFVKTH